MQLQPVKSSNIEAIGYDDGTSTLTVQFKGGRQYRYHDVPREHYDKMWARRHGKGLGKYFQENIKKGDFKFEKVEKE